MLFMLTETINSGSITLPLQKKRKNAKPKRECSSIKENHMVRDDVDFFKRQLSSDSREEDCGFNEYESLSLFNLPRSEGPIDIVIAVQAVSVSSRRVTGDIPIDNLALDLTSGHAIVGIIREKGKAVEGYEVGDRVAAIVQSLSQNPRYTKVSADVVVRVPCGVDSADAASCAYTYLRAFQSLNHGDPFRQRYTQNSLRGQSILIIDGMGQTGQATIQLAKIAGAKKVYAIGDESHHRFLESLGSIPLNPNDWITSVEKEMDLVIDSVQSDHYKQFTAGKALKPNGKLVCVGTPLTMDGLRKQSCHAFIEDFFAQINLMLVEQKKATFYDLFSSVFHYPEIMKVRKSIILEKVRF